MNFSEIGYLENFPEFDDKGSPLCSKVDPEMFFPLDPVEGSSNYREQYISEQEAKSLCGTCPYKFECLAYAMKIPEIQGIWGGTTQGERRSLKRSIRTHQKARQML